MGAEEKKWLAKQELLVAATQNKHNEESEKAAT